MSDNSTNSKRIAKNTLVLYIRTIISLCISLYTSRVVLCILGIENYGIYNIIGGFVALFAIISQTMVLATQRYLTFELGKTDNSHSREVYSVALTIHVLLGIILLFLFETVGLWFLNTKLNIDLSRMVAANWLYQFSVITFVLNVVRAPYEASIIAHEKMSTYAYVNIVEVVLKLIIVYLLLLSQVDRLVQYGFYLMVIAVIIFAVYVMYCKMNFSEIKFGIVRKKAYYQEMVSFAGYNFIGSCSAIFATQGVNIILNVFYGVIVNAARGIALQVGAAISKFVNDFTTALNPQITKSYARGDMAYAMNLVYKGAKFSFFLYLLFSLPIMMQTSYILTLWLTEVPEYTVTFVRYTLIISLLNTFANPLTTLAFATGNVKTLSIWLGFVRLSVLPLCYIAFKLGYTPEYAYIIALITDFVLLFIRLNIVCKLVHIPRIQFLSKVILKVVPTTLLTLLAAIISNMLINVDSVIFLLSYTLIVCVFSSIIIYITGFCKSERLYIKNFILTKIRS